ncbi:hypothetical protein BDR07DRAFT_1498484 [Suillus spraguei]|nr:hypothetical protein BDR07DRAFT_1498484 [Suillus spraguei]
MANWTDHQRQKNAVTAMNLQTNELVRRVRKEFQGVDLQTPETEAYEEENDYEDWTFDEESEQQVLAETFKRFWTAWCVAEYILEKDPSKFGAQSFSLIALGRMLETVKASHLM